MVKWDNAGLEDTEAVPPPPSVGLSEIRYFYHDSPCHPDARGDPRGSGFVSAGSSRVDMTLPRHPAGIQ